MTGRAARMRAYRMRPYQARNRDGCSRIFEAVQREVFASDPPRLYRRADFARATRGEGIWIAEAAGAVVGLVSLWRPDPFIHYLLVAKAWRGRGVGATLLDAALRTISGAADLKCRIDNAAACRFYQHLGWYEIGRDQTCRHPYIRYRSTPP